jgi:uncharacterized protein YhhL (DUF1145 family)
MKKAILNAIFVTLGLATSFFAWYLGLVALVMDFSNPLAVITCFVGGFVIAVVTIASVSND